MSDPGNGGGRSDRPGSIHEVISRTQLNWSNEREPVATVASGQRNALSTTSVLGCESPIVA